MIWLIGTGYMGIEYAKVLRSLGIDFITIGRGAENALKYEEETGNKVIQGGLRSFLQNKPEKPSAVIVAVGVDMLFETSMDLLDYGISKILVEKPGFATLQELVPLVKKTEALSANVFLAYNRRFYSSVFKAEEIIQTTSGVTSFNFEFTEWSHVIANIKKPEKVMHNWLLANSSHVIDTAFFLGGKPTELNSYHQGGVSWHPSASMFSGAGKSDKGALFSYFADWEAPGRWSIEILTKDFRLYLKPMEKLLIQKLGSVQVDNVEIDDGLDKEFKPGLYLQTKAFLDGDYSRFCTIQQQLENVQSYYLKISGYSFNS